VEPVIPDDWPGFELTWRYKGTVYEIKVKRQGDQALNPRVPLIENGGTVPVEVLLPSVRAQGTAPLNSAGAHISGDEAPVLVTG
jgi:cellobiose phosphorylase